MSIGENIREKREARDMTATDLAKEVGVSLSMISQIERGSKTPNMALGKRIADVLDCSLDKLME